MLLNDKVLRLSYPVEFTILFHFLYYNYFGNHGFFRFFSLACYQGVILSFKARFRGTKYAGLLFIDGDRIHILHKTWHVMARFDRRASEERAA